jgi:hypothetical protein
MLGSNSRISDRELIFFSASAGTGASAGGED